MNLFVRRLLHACRTTPKKLRSWRLARQARKKLQASPRPYKLNVGCGKVHFPGWINIDLDASLPTVDLVWDLTTGIPTEADSCALIYCEHVLEHMTAEDGVRFLRDCHRALQPGGILRVAMPSLDNLITKSYEGTWRDQDWLTWPGFGFIQTRAEMLNIAFRWWGHLWLYDREELHRRLQEAGFSQLSDVEWCQSEIPELRNRETRKDSLLVCEARKQPTPGTLASDTGGDMLTASVASHPRKPEAIGSDYQH